VNGRTVRLPVAGSSEFYTVAPGKIIALGLNYHDHIAESASVKVSGFGPETPSEPVLFPKLPSCLVGPDEPIVLPRIVATYGFDEPRTDYEAELALIIGRECREVAPDEALGFVYGYTCMNDVSQRNIQNGDRSGWFRGKSFDTFGPIGPVVVPASRIPDVQSLDIVCRLNGQVVQSSNTGAMIFSVAETVSFISRNFTLYPGDVILTGTPAGVGPIAHGDVVEVEISEIGILRNPVVDPDRGSAARRR
jgi:2-keto-4-pentenoate hydratase/2-oxohepta-3-ene-1,7-dioic acid hydratase in catechol pathway